METGSEVGSRRDLCLGSPICLPCSLQVTAQKTWPGAGPEANGARVLGVWGLVRVRIWVSATGGAVEMDSGKLRVGKTGMFRAVKGCPGMAGLGAWAPRPRGTHTGLWCPLGFFLPGHPERRQGGNGSLGGVRFEDLEPGTMKIIGKFSHKSEANETEAIIH